MARRERAGWGGAAARSLTLPLLLALSLLLGLVAGPAAGQPRDLVREAPERLVLYVPSAAGGGWDQTAIAMKAALEGEGLAREVAIVRRPGGGGLVGLAQFVEARRGDPRYLLIGGNVMDDAAQTNQSPVSLLDTTPIARLAADYLAVAVPAASPLRDAEDLLRMLRRNPEAVRWTGGQDGGPDARLARRIVQAAGGDAASIVYRPQLPGGTVTRVLQGDDPAVVMVGGYGKFAPYAAHGDLRLLAVAAEGPAFAGVPTLQGAGLDIVAMNWRGVFAPPGLDEVERRRLVETITAMAAGPMWRDAVRRHGWRDVFAAGEPFQAFVVQEQERSGAMASAGRGSQAHGGEPRQALRPGDWATGAVGVAGLAAVVVLVLQLRRGRRREAELRRALGAVEPPALKDMDRVPQAALVGAIDGQFQRWGLTAAERDVAWFMLKGLPMKEIARLRGTSERTIRQQARSIYGKAGVEGRSDLAGHVLDQFLASDPGARADAA